MSADGEDHLALLAAALDQILSENGQKAMKLQPPAMLVQPLSEHDEKNKNQNMSKNDCDSKIDVRPPKDQNQERTDTTTLNATTTITLPDNHSTTFPKTTLSQTSITSTATTSSPPLKIVAFQLKASQILLSKPRYRPRAVKGRGPYEHYTRGPVEFRVMDETEDKLLAIYTMPLLKSNERILEKGLLSLQNFNKQKAYWDITLPIYTDTLPPKIYVRISHQKIQTFNVVVS